MRVRDAALRTRIVGAPNGTMWVALHGYPDTLRVFEPLALSLAETHRTLLFDWPGQGRSDDLSVYDPRDRADFLRDLLDAAEIDRTAILAHDMGVLPALAFAERHPGRVSRLVLAHALLDDDGPVSVDIRVLRGARLYPWALGLAPGFVFDRCIASFLAPGHALSGEALAEMRTDFVARRGNVVRLCRAYDAALPTFLPALGPIAAPIDLLWSTGAVHFPLAHAEALVKKVHSARITPIADAKHWLFAQGGTSRGKIVDIMRFPP
ncbi:hypothetical protein BH09MYX1_BH09MYX1_31000 [soil metagenome]